VGKFGVSAPVEKPRKAWLSILSKCDRHISLINAYFSA
jgi:hypothetical protein